MQGSINAQYNLGVIYDTGRGVANDLSEQARYEIAVEWYQKAAYQGNAKAQYNLGGCMKRVKV